MSDKPSIPQVRQRIDQIDDTILELLKERLDCARTIGLLKDETSRAKWDPQRELEIYERLKAKNLLIVPGHYFFPGIDDPQWRHSQECIRLNYSQSEELVRRGIAILADEINAIYRGS